MVQKHTLFKAARATKFLNIVKNISTHGKQMQILENEFCWKTMTLCFY